MAYQDRDENLAGNITRRYVELDTGIFGELLVVSHTAPGEGTTTDDDGLLVQRVRSRMEGWYAGGLDWRRVAVDADGNLGVAVAGGSSGLTDTELRATPVAVTGPLTDTQLRASAVPVSVAALPLPSGAATESTLAAASAKLPAVLVSGRLDVNVGASTTIAVSQSGTWTVQPGNTANTTAWKVDGSAVTQPVSVAALPLPSGAAKDSTLTDGTQRVGGTVAVSGTFWQSTQPVSIASMPSTPVTGTFWQSTQPVSIASMPSTPVTGTFWQSTQPVSLAAAVAVTDNSGSLTVDAPVATPVFVRLSDGAAAITTLAVSAASLPLPTGAATNTVLTDGTVRGSMKLLDTGGSNVASISAAGALKVDGSAVTQPVSIASAVPITDNSGSLTVDQPTGTNLHTVVDSGTITTITNVVHVDDNSGSLTVDAPVATPVFVRLSDGSAAISTLQVSLATLPALTAGSAAIGKLAANDGVDIGDVTLNNASIAVTGTFWQATQPVSVAQPSTTAVSAVTGTGASIQIVASNASRKTLSVFNNSGVTAYVKLATGASSSSFTVKLVDQAYYELPSPVYTGAVYALWASGDMLVTEA